MVKIHSGTRHKINKNFITKETQTFLDKKGFSSDTMLNIIFVGKRKMLEIANTYKHENVALPVLSFTYRDDVELKNHDESLLGEIFICYPQAVLLAAERERTVDQTLMQLIEHGIENLMK